MTIPIHQQVKASFDKGGLQAAFRDVLGWTTVTGEEESFPAPGFTARGSKIASMLNGVVVFQFNFPEEKSVSPSLQKDISKAVGAKYAERLVIFETKETATWLWPKKTAGGALTHEKIVVPAKTLPLFLAQRLAALAFTGEEHMRGVSIQQLREKLRGSFDTSTVTKKFYEKFKNQHQELASSISGLTEDQAGSYATLLLNRLMFIYFLQKKEFLNKDPNYLRTCLTKVQELEQPSGFYNFYRDLLLVLFFEGLNKKDRTFKTPQIEKIIGDVPYVNGGIFGETEIEREHKIEVPDSVFENIFTFFDSFTWHLDTRPTGKSDEINPEVIGYIFEQYINFTAGGKKENGAYYTKQDVTGYMVGQTLVPKMLDILVENGLNPLALLPASGDRYINESMLHGWSSDTAEWLAVDSELEQCWLGDPIGWNLLDEADLDPQTCLPGETWVEMFHRRDRVENLRGEIASGSPAEVNDLITLNLNSQLLLLDALLTIDNESDLKEIWERLATLSIIDPTCGSGAFLFAALEVLEDIYGHLIDVAEELSASSIYAASLVAEVSTHPNRRYFVRKRASLNNLFGTDLMADAVETAKLRVFLALASCLDRGDRIEPLPDLDFNFKPGNLLVGFKNADDSHRVFDGDVFAHSSLGALEPKISIFQREYEQYLIAADSGAAKLHSLKLRLGELSKDIRDDCNAIMCGLLNLEESERLSWVTEQKPFHWFAEFPRVILGGGFDVIVGNPPYIRQNKAQRIELESSGVRGFASKDCPDIYARCYERSLSLLREDGRQALIVPINLAYSGDFESLRRLIDGSPTKKWWSTYDQLPQGLFEGAAVRNTIYVQAPAKEHSASSSNHQIFTVASRAWLFGNLNYVKSSAANGSAPFRGGILNSLFESVQAYGGSLGRTTKGSICLKSSANYWVPVSPHRPPILDANFVRLQIRDKKIRELEVGELEDEVQLLCLLSGKLGFLWWQAVGDGLDTISGAFLPLRVRFAQYRSASLSQYAIQTLQAGMANTVVNYYMGKNYVSIRWAGIRDVSDYFDRELLREADLIEYWRPINIAYRMIMKSNDARQSGQSLERNAKYWNA